YVDWEKGMDRSSFWVPGGLSSLQEWIGSDSLPKQIPQNEPSLRGRPRSDSVKENSEYVRSWREDKRLLIGKYLCRIGSRHSDTGLDWQIEVNDTQLTPNDEIIRDAIFEFIYQSYSSPQPGKLASALFNKNISALLFRSVFLLEDMHICNYETLVSRGICNYDTLSPEDISNFETLVNDLICHFEILVSQNICNFDTVINILIRLKNTFKIPIYTQPQYTALELTPPEQGQPEKEVVIGYFNDQNWKLEQILSRVNPVLSKQIREDIQPISFISWLIYGSLTSKITSPMSFAVARTLETRMDAGGTALRLARAIPKDLAMQLLVIKQRLGKGYMGDSAMSIDTLPELKTFLLAESSNQGKLILIQRLIDNLGISLEHLQRVENGSNSLENTK
ncbi:MAG: hypothetical protein MUO40_08720, partial [Anaerolineaceae bacterium]|nr:hypothetical protein [Anaerolineaceae bacterium]